VQLLMLAMRRGGDTTPVQPKNHHVCHAVVERDFSVTPHAPDATRCAFMLMARAMHNHVSLCSHL